MKNYIQNGKIITYTLPESATVTSGQVVIIGTLKGVAQTSGVAGDKVTVSLYGVYELPKATGAITQGALVYWAAAGNPIGGVAGSGAITTTASGNTLLGQAFEGVASGDAFINVRLNN